MYDNSRSDQYSERIIDLLSKIADEDPKDKQAKSDARRRGKRHLKALTDNGLALVGLSRGMWSLSKVVGDQLAMNSRLAEGLGQTANALKGVVSVTERFITGQQTYTQSVKVFTDAVNLGMTTFSNETLQFGSQLKVLALQNKTAFQLIRANTQGLGLSEDASLRLTQELVTTAAENKDSISGLIAAINGMKDAMISTTVELGPKTALNAQKIAAMMAQGNSELQESSAKFVKSFLAGSDGYMKAAKLGVRFEEGESLSSMARKFEIILSKVQGLQAGKRGGGSQFFFDAMEEGFDLSRADFNLQRQIGTTIEALKENNVQQLSRASAEINLQQQIGESLNGIQAKLGELTQYVTEGFVKVREKLEGVWTNMKSWYDRNLKDQIGDFGKLAEDLSPVVKVLATVLGIGAGVKAVGALAGGAGILGRILLALTSPAGLLITTLAIIAKGTYDGWDDLMAGNWKAFGHEFSKAVNFWESEETGRRRSAMAAAYRLKNPGEQQAAIFDVYKDYYLQNKKGIFSQYGMAGVTPKVAKEGFANLKEMADFINLNLAQGIAVKRFDGGMIEPKISRREYLESVIRQLPFDIQAEARALGKTAEDQRFQFIELMEDQNTLLRRNQMLDDRSVSFEN